MEVKKTAQVYFSLVCALAFIVPLSQFASVRLLVVLCIGFFAFGGLRARARLFVRNAWENILFLVVLLAGLLYSDDVGDGFKVLETSFSLLAMPLIFCTVGVFTERKVNSIFNFFATGLALACGICLVNAFINYRTSHDPGVFFFEQLTDVLNSQPTYFAYYLIFAIAYGLYMVYYDLSSVPRWVSIAFIIFYFLVLMLTGGRTTFISLLLIFSFFVLKFLLEQRNSRKNLVFVSVCLMLAVLFTFNSIESLETYLSVRSDYWERSPLWKSAIVANENPLLGVGTGDYKNVLNEYFIRNGLPDFAADSYNSHNQFIQVYFSNGILGLIALMLLLGRSLYLTIRNQDTLGMLTLFPFFIYGMTEVFLGRYQGVVLFGLLQQLTVARNTVLSDDLRSKVR